MSIRLNKASRELNVGIQTAVDFLQKKNLGEVKADPNAKISDEQYDALVKEFKGDKDLRSQAEKLFHGHSKEKNEPQTNNSSTKAETILQANRPVFKPVGKIDLDSIGKKPVVKDVVVPEVKKEPEQKAAPVTSPSATAEVKVTVDAKPQTAEVKVQAPVTKQEAPKIVPQQQNNTQQKQKEEEQTKKTEQPKVFQQPKVVSAPKEPEQIHNAQHNNNQHERPRFNQPRPIDKQPVQKPQVQKPQIQNNQPAEASKEKEQPSNHIFTLKSESKLAPKVNVLGKIDLDSLNQSTRPKKKTKEERRKEREEKNHQNNTVNGERKKRVRINKERVDVNAAVNQGGGNNNNNNRNRNNNGNNNNGNNNNGNNNNNNSGSSRRNRRRNQQVNKPLEVNEEDVAKQVKETLARLTSKTQNQNKKGAKYRKEKREAVQERMAEVRQEEKAESKIIKLTEFVTANELATMMNVPVNKVIATCMSIGIMVSINQRLDAETINLVADEFGFKTEYVSAEVAEAISEEDDDEEDLLPRAPIVTVMGHVDHGKTSLLDYIRKANVIAGEAGGITQHIGAYNVKLESGRHITFLDTPGHEAFTAMRARGAQVTDIAIIIIAADDSVMPTTREAIAHAQAANVPMVFAINKIDKPGANPDKIREQLAQMNILVEDWGGKYQCQEISAKKGVGVKELLEKVLLEAEMLDLKANPNRKATGSIIEAQLDKGRGYVSTVLVSNGTLRAGDVVLAGTSYGRIKAMFNERNQRIKQAGPAEPAMILGLNGAPQAGDAFHVID